MVNEQANSAPPEQEILLPSQVASLRSPMPSASGVPILPALLEYLTELQKQTSDPESGGNANANLYGPTILRQIRARAPQGTLTVADESAIELVTTIFGYVYVDTSIASDLKRLIGRLQIPMLKVALSDKDCFFEEDHPAPRLLDLLAQSSATWDHKKGRDDPFYKMIEQLVQRVEQELVPHIGLLVAMVSDLENFLAAEETISENALTDVIAEAMRLESMQQARALAENDIASRIETGEVAGFVEVFLETQWMRILTLAHNVAESKPDALVRVLKAMDDLVWSIKPKTSPEERKELVIRLPAMLSLINAWLNVLKWEGPERDQFFSKLAERHASIARATLELSPRLQVELAVNVAEKASDRLLQRRVKKMEAEALDEFTRMIENIPCGEWVDFLRNDGSRGRFKLAWVSPKRSRFIFMNGAGQSPLPLTSVELAQAFRHNRAAIAPKVSVVDRALRTVLTNVNTD
jgi:hypothetical protein